MPDLLIRRQKEKEAKVKIVSKKDSETAVQENIKEIELLYFEGCPSWKTTHQYLKNILKNLDLDKKITLRNIKTNEDAVKFEFPGSPTIRVNQVDLFPIDQADYALRCRIYQTPNGLKGSPTKEMILKNLLEKI